MPRKRAEVADFRTLAFSSGAVPEGAEVLWSPQPGPQTEVLLRPEDEILYGGARFGGKSIGGLFFLIKGNPDLPQDDPVNVSYINHPGYRALVLRHTFEDLHDWIAKAKHFYGKLPSSMRPEWRYEREFVWPSGATFAVGHLDSKDAHRKYVGHQYQRLLLEEASLIADETTYVEVLGSIRSEYRELRPQTMLNTNPVGAGLGWIKARWIIDPATGLRRPAGVPFVVHVKLPDGSVRDLTRVFVPALATDNPAGMAADPMYLARLMADPSEARRKAYVYGDWDAFAGGLYFSDFRRRPNAGEPEDAFHCVKSGQVKFEPWHNRWWGMDWGFDHPAVFVECVHHEEEERFYISRELRFRHTSSRSMGVEWASTVARDLQPNSVVTLWVSFDMYRKYVPGEPSGESDLELLMAGIESVLGRGTVQIIDASQPMEDLEIRQSARVLLRRAPNNRQAGWGLLRDLMDWRQLTAAPPVYSHDYAMSLQASDSVAYARYLKTCRESRAPKRGIPKLRFIEDGCPSVISWLERASFDDDGEDVKKTDADRETGKGGDDEGDALRYVVAGTARSQSNVPAEELLRRRIRELVAARGGMEFSAGEMAAILPGEIHKLKAPEPYRVARTARARLRTMVN